MKRSTMIAVSVLLTMAVTWAAYGQAGGGGGRGRGGFGMMGAQAQKVVADLQEQVTKLKALVDAGAKATAGGFQDMSEEDRAKMKERSTQQQALMAAIQKDVDQLRVRQIAAEYNQSMTALKDAQASAQKENAKETAQKLGQIIAEREKQMEEKVTAMGMTMDDLQKMGTRGGGRRQQ
jgi:methylmalonyl-CoA mutase cobalamin-binding subunit